MGSWPRLAPIMARPRGPGTPETLVAIGITGFFGVLGPEPERAAPGPHGLTVSVWESPFFAIGCLFAGLECPKPSLGSLILFLGLVSVFYAFFGLGGHPAVL